MKRSFLLFAALVISGAALAQTPAVNAARQSGAVGERYDGYLGFAGSPSAALRSQVDAVNIRRRSLYSNLATSRGVSPREVGITAGCQLLQRVQAGEAYMLSDGAWRRRSAGQALALPDYCS
jgi:uncharacterized protein YdbL (DUF1318 family)